MGRAHCARSIFESSTANLPSASSAMMLSVHTYPAHHEMKSLISITLIAVTEVHSTPQWRMPGPPKLGGKAASTARRAGRQARPQLPALQLH